MRLDKLAPSTRVQGRWLCHLEDGSILLLGENEVVSFGLYTGMELSGEALEELTAAAGRTAALDKALSLLSSRPLSRKELVDKLTARPREKDKEGIGREQAEAAADRLEELGYLNDAEYAAAVARHYSAKGYGQRRVRDELFRRGVPREHWEAALLECEAPEEGIDAFLARKLRGRTPDERELKRLSDALARRGYRWEDINAALRRYGAEIEEL